MIVVVGAGVVGLSCALALLARGRHVCVIEGRARPGQETSTHNSGVIHAGLYHPPESLKTTLCVEGRGRLYAFCEQYGVPHVRCGKLIVAGHDERDALDSLLASARANGVALDPIDRAAAAQREPEVAPAHAAWSPETGWIDTDAYIRTLTMQLDRLGGVLLVGTPLVAVEPHGDGVTIVTPRERIQADAVVNAAGLYADEVSRLGGGESFQIYPCRGEYAELAPRARGLVRGLVYPVPHPSGHGLGVHLTRTLGGAVWIGPTIRYQDGKSDYEDNRLPLADFLEPTRALLPSITLDDLRLAGSGIRPKLHPPSERFADFLIRRDRQNPALIHAAGIDSPGLTASLSIGELVAGLV
jgi:L-2-hydroxyglutarate oxidase LhgO